MNTLTTTNYIRENYWYEKLVRSPLFWVIFTFLAFSYPIVRSVYRQLPPDLPMISQVPSFELKNEFGQPFGSNDLKGKIYIASFMFTSCPTVCPSLMAEVKKIQKRVRGLGQNIALVSFSVDPETDTPKVLYRYARELRSNPHVWKFLTGPRADLENLLVKGFYVPMGNLEKLTNEQGESQDINLYDIAHTEKLVLVDRDGKIRGYYSSEVNDINRLMIDVGLLINKTTYHQES